MEQLYSTEEKEGWQGWLFVEILAPSHQNYELLGHSAIVL